MLKTKREGAEYKLDERKKLITRLWGTEANSLWGTREDDLHQVGVLDKVLQCSNVAAGWAMVGADNGISVYKRISEMKKRGRAGKFDDRMPDCCAEMDRKSSARQTSERVNGSEGGENTYQ